MNYAGHEKLRAEVAEVANNMCDLRATLNGMEHSYRFDSDVLAERLTRQTLFRIKGSPQKTESMVTPVFATPILTTSWLA